MRRLIYILPLFFLCSCSYILSADVAVTECEAMPEGRAAATAFVCNGEGYVFGGRTQDGTYLNTICKYNPKDDSWTNLGATPLKARVNAVACVIRDTVYIGLGYWQGHVYVDSCYLQDFWQYVPKTNEWKRLTDYPNHETDGCICFCDSQHVYTGFGYDGNHTRKMFTYSLKDSTWVQQSISKLSIPTAVFAPVGAQAGDRYFMGTGFTTESSNQWYEYIPTQSRFVRLTVLPEKGRDSAAAAGNSTHVYLFGGQRFGGTMTTLEYYDDVLRYSTATGTWEYCVKLPYGGVIEPYAFTIGEKVYVGGGETRDGRVMSNLYRYEE